MPGSCQDTIAARWYTVIIKPTTSSREAKENKMYTVKYDGQVVGTVVSNQSLTDEEVIRLAGIDLDGKDPYGENWTWELFEITYE